MGIIDSVDSINGKIEILFEGRRIIYERMEIADLQPAYAISVHKSQGSEYPSCDLSPPQATLYDAPTKSGLYWTYSGQEKSHICG